MTRNADASVPFGWLELFVLGGALQVARFRVTCPPYARNPEILHIPRSQRLLTVFPAPSLR